VFARATEDNAVTPGVRVRLYRAGSLVNTYTIASPGNSVPTSIDEGDLTQSWNVSIPASVMEPGLSVLADIDPSNSVTESDESNNVFPQAGSAMALDVRTVSPFEVTFVPVLQEPNGLLGDVTDDNASDYLSFADRVYPLSSSTALVHATYTFDGVLTSDNANGNWSRLLSEIDALRVAEGSGRYYYGVVRRSYSSGISGIGYVGWPTALGWDHVPGRAETAAHEWGHNFGRLHVDCGGPSNPDPDYPYAGGSIGVWGFDLHLSELRSPDTYVDLMSYCSPEWISDYTYEGVLDYRATSGSAAATAASQRVLLVWGRIGRDDVVLEPALELTAAPSLPERPGPYRIQGIDGFGREVFDLTFEGAPVEDVEAGRQFAFTVPMPEAVDRVAELRLYADGREAVRSQPPAGVREAPGASDVTMRAAGEAVSVRWQSTVYPIAMVRDARTGEVLSFARGGAAELFTLAREFEVVLSDGVSSVLRIVQLN
jgi:hypothetical protein